ncbi:MAG: cyclic nucleotide-binding domain-containing protein, partial [Chloroflexaceae bacterium]|nr:cyclic nucleotide-binding domain-containing protein [Chloroflexaceae bacterium]
MGKRNTFIETQTALHTEQQRTQRAARLAALRALDCLHNVPNAELDRLIDLCLLRAFPPHERLFQEREPGTFLYLLMAGSVRLTASARNGREVPLNTISHGDCFGEGLLFGDYFQRVAAYTETVCFTLQLPLDDVRRLLRTAPGLHGALRQIHTERLAAATLARVPLFSNLEPLERATVITLLKFESYPRGTPVIQEGQQG